MYVMDSKIQLVEHFFILNGQVIRTNSFAYKFPAEAKIVYEVIRVKNSTPLFFEHHMARLMNSIKILNFELPQLQAIKEQVKSLLVKNPIAENNLRISLIYRNACTFDTLIYFVPSTYPTAIQKQEGVEVKLFKANRDNPNAKVENKTLRESADKIIAESGCYEVLLVNDQGFITEGSRSNVFFIKDDTFYTAPLSMVLGGITRLVIIEIIKNLGLSLVEKPINIDEIDIFDCAFITGTSPSLLPVCQINDTKFNVRSFALQKLMDEYSNAIEKDIANFKK